MLISDYKNTFDPIKLVLLRTPMVVPKWDMWKQYAPPLGLAYVAASFHKLVIKLDVLMRLVKHLYKELFRKIKIL